MHRTLLLVVLLMIALLLAGTRQLAAQNVDGPLIRLKSASFDPLAAQSLAAASANHINGHDVVLVQFKGPVQEAWIAAVRQLGVRLYGYVPDYTFVTRLNGVSPDQVQRLPFVRWIGAYRSAHKLDPQLTTAAPPSNTLMDVTLQTLPDADTAAIEQQIAAWGGAVQARATNQLAGYLHAKLPSDRLIDVAAVDGVLWIEPYVEITLNDNVAAHSLMRAADVRSTLGLYGKGQVIAVADTGLDTGQLDTTHADLRGRVRAVYCLGRPSPCDWSDPHGHGTHVAGSALGNGARSGSNPAQHAYGASFAGVAPEAELVVQSILSQDGKLGGIPRDIGDLMRQAYRDGARIHSNSWGGATCADPPTCSFLGYGGYALSSQQVDLAAWQHKDMLVLFAARSTCEIYAIWTSRL